MDTELRKRLEEAADKYIKIITEDIPYYHKEVKQGFMVGAEQGYKEAITQAKKWLKKQLIDCDYTYLDDELIVNFEADMNKLWEE